MLYALRILDVIRFLFVVGIELCLRLCGTRIALHSCLARLHISVTCSRLRVSHSPPSPQSVSAPDAYTFYWSVRVVVSDHKREDNEKFFLDGK